MREPPGETGARSIKFEAYVIGGNFHLTIDGDRKELARERIYFSRAVLEKKET